MNKKKVINILSYALAGSIVCTSCTANLRTILGLVDDNKYLDIIDPESYSSSELETTDSISGTFPNLLETTNTESIETEVPTISTEVPTISTEVPTFETVESQETVETQEIIESQEIVENQETVETQETLGNVEVDDSTIDTSDESVPSICEEDFNSGVILEDTLLYAEPNDRSSKVSNLCINDSVVKLLDGKNDWDLVRSNDHIGFIKEGLINYNEQVSDDFVHYPLNDIAVVNTKELHFRSGPSTDYDIITSLRDNQEVRVIAETDDDWLLVKYGDKTGYIFKDYTYSLLDKLKEEYPDMASDDLSVKKVVYNPHDLNLRVDSSTDSDIACTFEAEQALRVIDENDEWAFVLDNDHNFGYVYKDLIEDLNGVFVEIDVSDQELKLYDDNLLIYSTPVTTGKDSTPTDLGLSKVWYMERDCYITDKNFVHYWIVFNQSIEGIHDAWWRKIYGQDDYKTNGSNGCVNTPLEEVAKIYDSVELGTKVLVHK